MILFTSNVDISKLSVFSWYKGLPRSKGVLRGYVRSVTRPLHTHSPTHTYTHTRTHTHTHTHTHTLLKFVGILRKCVGKISIHNFVDNFGVFCHKKTESRILSKFRPAEIKLLLAMMTFKEVI